MRYVRWTAVFAFLLAAPTAWLGRGQSDIVASGLGIGSLARAPAHQAVEKPEGERVPPAKVSPGLPSVPLDGRTLPGPAQSQYLKTTNSHVLFRLGCAEARRQARVKSHSAIVVLAFGRPMKGPGGRLGASLFGAGFRSTYQIQAAAEAYANGYARCSPGHRAARLNVAIGTSNFGRAVGYRHGAAWARMVNRANDWLAQEGHAHLVEFAGANDIELGWNGPRVSKAWVRGYDSVAEWPYYDYGDAAGCPPRGNCVGAWTLEDVWYVSWGARTAWPLPEIYTNDWSMASQWYHLSLYSYTRHGWRMTIAGALSQRAACKQSSDPCRGMNNSPARAWGQLNRLLNRDRRTAQHLPWLSDIHWAH